VEATTELRLGKQAIGGCPSALRNDVRNLQRPLLGHRCTRSSVEGGSHLQIPPGWSISEHVHTQSIAAGQGCVNPSGGYDYMSYGQKVLTRAQINATKHSRNCQEDLHDAVIGLRALGGRKVPELIAFRQAR